MGDLFFKTAATIGLYGCTATDTWATVGAGTILGSGGADNTIPRMDGAGGLTLQSSALLIDDNNIAGTSGAGGWTVQSQQAGLYSDGSNGLLSFSKFATIRFANANNSGLGAGDSGLNRASVGVIAVNDGTSLDGTTSTGVGEYLTSGALTSVTNTTANSCGTSVATLGANSLNSAGFFTVGATSGTSCTLTFSVAAPHGWICKGNDESTVSINPVWTRLTTTTGKFTGVFTAADVVTYTCKAY